MGCRLTQEPRVQSGLDDVANDIRQALVHGHRGRVPERGAVRRARDRRARQQRDEGRAGGVRTPPVTPGLGRKPGTSLHTRKRLSLYLSLSLSLTHSLTGARAKAWCLLIHVRASLSRGPGRKPGASVYTRKHTRGSVSLLGRDGLARAALLVHYLHVSWGARATLLIHRLYLHLTWGAGIAWTAYCTGNKMER
jgi:hypothetical protein